MRDERGLKVERIRGAQERRLRGVVERASSVSDESLPARVLRRRGIFGDGDGTRNIRSEVASSFPERGATSDAGRTTGGSWATSDVAGEVIEEVKWTECRSDEEVGRTDCRFGEAEDSRAIQEERLDNVSIKSASLISSSEVDEVGD